MRPFRFTTNVQYPDATATPGFTTAPIDGELLYLIPARRYQEQNENGPIRIRLVRAEFHPTYDGAESPVDWYQLLDLDYVRFVKNTLLVPEKDGDAIMDCRGDGTLVRRSVEMDAMVLACITNAERVSRALGINAANTAMLTKVFGNLSLKKD
tara:strand:- start:2600 stop:3058 length:459 start_codon:yes stop_codon:yes gene_type:complete